VAVLVVGLLLSVGTGALSWLGMRAFERHLKAA
jgi:hypothetical protein